MADLQASRYSSPPPYVGFLIAEQSEDTKFPKKQP
jgi:hypothetical protein